MAITRWQPSTLYLKDQIVYPSVVSGASPVSIPNADFENGDTGWTKGTGWSINTNIAFNGTYSAEYVGPGAAELISETKIPIAAGKAITAFCFVHQGASDDGQANAAVVLRWYDSVGTFISDSTGNSVSTGAVAVWKKSTVSAVAPPNAASVSIGCNAYNDWAALNVDGFGWNYVTGVAATSLAFKATFPGGEVPPGEGEVSDASYTGTNVSFEAATTSGGSSFQMPSATFAYLGGYGQPDQVGDADGPTMASTGIKPNDRVQISGSQKTTELI
jgi:hypothetical protein